MKYYEKVKEIVVQEIGDMPFFEEWKLEFTHSEDKYEWYTLHNKLNPVEFRACEDKIQIDLYDNNYVEIEWFETSVKHFWWAILSWEKK